MSKKISICVTYYNQKDYVKPSLDSVLSIDFPCDFEILCGDDGSTDGTLDIVKEYQQNYPDKIKYFVIDRTNSPKYVNRVSLNRLNLAKNATGDYIMFLDGDDFYCDTSFVKEAFNILETDHKLEACFFNYKYLYPDNSEKIIIQNRQTGYINVKDYIGNSIYIHAEAFVFRNILSKKDFEKLYKINHFDDNGITIYMLNFGSMYYVNRPVYVYRQTNTGIWTGVNEFEQHAVNGYAYKLLCKLAPKYKKQLAKRSYYPIKYLYRNKENIKNLLGENYNKYLTIAKNNKDRFIENILSWNSLNIFRRIKTIVLWKNFKKIAENKHDKIFRFRKNK